MIIKETTDLVVQQSHLLQNVESQIAIAVNAIAAVNQNADEQSKIHQGKIKALQEKIAIQKASSATLDQKLQALREQQIKLQAVIKTAEKTLAEKLQIVNAPCNF